MIFQIKNLSSKNLYVAQNYNSKKEMKTRIREFDRLVFVEDGA